MSEKSNQLAVTAETPAFIKASDRLSLALGIPKEEMLTTLKVQCFRGTNPDNVSNAQLAAFISIANDMGVNPLLPGMLYAYPDRGAIFPIMGPDGVFKKLAESPVIESWEVVVYPEDVSLPATHAIAKIWRKSIERPVTYTALLSEWKVGSNPNWNSRPRHMLTIRALKQAARQIIHGLPGDEDDRIISEINVTPAKPVERPPLPEQEKKGVAAVKQVIEADATVVDEKRPAPAEEKKAESKADRKAEKKADPAPEKPAVKTTLAENEKFVAVVEVQQFKTKLVPVQGKPTPSIFAEVKGDYVGDVVHLGGATAEGEQLKELPAWQIEKPVKLALLGKKNSAGRIMAVVESISIEGSAASQPEEF